MSIAYEVPEESCEPEPSVPASSSSASSSCDSRDPSLLIVFDWDDTLFPTTWSINDSSASKEARGLLEDAYIVLTDALKLGHVSIVTAAARSWLQQCAESHEGIVDLFDS